MCFRLPCYKAGLEAISLWGGLKIPMMGENVEEKGSVKMHNAIFHPLLPVAETFNFNPSAVALKTSYFLHKNLTLPPCAA